MMEICRDQVVIQTMEICRDHAATQMMEICRDRMVIQIMGRMTAQIAVYRTKTIVRAQTA